MRGQENPYLEICFRPTVATINEARRLVATLYGPLLANLDLADRVALATHEMLENALKYSVDGATVVRVELSHSRGPRSVTIETRNLLSPERRAGLDEVFAEMARFGNAHEFYQFAMRRTRTLRHGSGLGLARIWAECDMRITHKFEGDEARVTAVLTIEDKKS
jgi:two-component sensor histidine kinase